MYVWRWLSEVEAAKVSEQVGGGRSACHLVVPTVDHDSQLWCRVN